MYPILSIFGISFGTYGICCVLGGIFAILLALRNAKQSQLARFSMLEACVWALFGGLLGAKLLYLLVSCSDIYHMFQDYGVTWDTICSILEGGFVFYGGLLGGLASLAIYAHKQQQPLQRYLTCIAPAVPLAHAFGRIGCFFAGCCYGIPFDPPIGICLTSAISDAPKDVPLFPVQLLESGLNFILALILQICFQKLQKKEYVISFYLLAYAVIRMATEQFRYDAERGIWLGLSTSEWISIGIFLCGLFLLFLQKYKSSAKSVKE